MNKPSFRLGDDIEKVTDEGLSDESSATDQAASVSDEQVIDPEQTSSASSSDTDQADNITEQSSSGSDTPPIAAPSTQKIGTDNTDKPARSSTERTYTFRATPELDDILQQIIEQKNCGKGEAVLVLVEELLNRKPETVEVERVVEKPVEVVKEVPRPLMSGEHLVKLTEPQERTITQILARRKALAAQKGIEVNETVAEILVKALFIKGRLFNYDNEFYTGLTKSDVA